MNWVGKNESRKQGRGGMEKKAKEGAKVIQANFILIKWIAKLGDTFCFPYDKG